ncbi:MAG: nucleotide exchange factor GrpE [Actinomycetota bacterium]|nr:nucleotide exchange factor GrpE [Actinomycetota bacterium]
MAESEPVATDRPAGADPEDSGGALPSESDAALADADAALEGEGEQVSVVDSLVEEAEEAIAEDVSELSQLTMERDEYLNQLRRLQADFENYKKRVVRQQTEHLERATEELVGHLLPALDTFDLALAHGTEGLEPVYRSLLDILEGTGLERVDPLGQPFDPNEHDAVLHEEAEEDGMPASPEVVEVLRAGYRWKGRVLRPAMVKVKG